MSRTLKTLAVLQLFALLSTPALAEAPRCTDTSEPWTTLSRVEGDVVIDGEQQHIRFASLYDWLNWIAGQRAKDKDVAWPPTLQAIDFPGAMPDSGLMLDLPLSALEVNTAGEIETTDESSNPANGPWIVHTDDFVDGTFFPRYLVFANLQSAANVAATYHGELYHWDTGIKRINDLCLMMNMQSGGGAGQAEYRYEVTPGEPAPPDPAVLPGGEDDLG